jgi:hypothetical protein
MAIPNPLAFAWTNKATLNSGSCKEVGEGLDLILTLWKVAAE